MPGLLAHMFSLPGILTFTMQHGSCRTGPLRLVNLQKISVTSTAWSSMSTSPTRGPNTLDLILSDFPGNVTVTGHPPLGASDHICLLAIIPAPALRERPTKRTVWRYQQADWDRLRHSYRTSDWESSFTDNPDQSCEYVSSSILSDMKLFIPPRILVTRPTDPSWSTPECSDAVSAKQVAWKQMFRSPSPQHLVNARQATRACATRL